ncbi:MAG: alpha-glucosidase [Weissella confusa]|uniref:alpha-glucosidase n=1 Tax=Weissella confusa TaxID=1583 RepID=UPI00107FAFAD|nr:alpha-glucosidase [Weissella confusa]MBJ7641190.1 alpha-glucosidase [Weissella confusa]MBJ7655423.1 alpha-glucosidase [Weissella confusa]MBJ7659196.1 alpha-glucosidase [Weissella confusa]MBU5284893.1 alpha-glucosidase [Weissella confusa]QIE78086.1 alpha-glucosidase [Weissella confusa]
MAEQPWWLDEVVYQVYPRSFQDSNHDGIGDIRGIISRLDYIRDLGVTMIWVSPVYKSPMVDMGYDISDYQDIDPQFGSMADFKELLAEANKRGMKIIMDLVVNHTSDEHEWFQAALADKQSPYRDYYIFKTPADGQVPNNWRSLFGGSTWTEVPGEPGTYYFHSFAPEQPDLNWENPAMRRDIYDMINWWLEMGVAGFRIDAITHLKKDLDWASLPSDGPDGLVSVLKKGQNRPGIDDFLSELKAETFAKYDAVTIGEAYGVPDEDLHKYIGPDGYFSMIFDFSYMNIEVENTDEWYRGRSEWTTTDLRERMFNSQKQVHEIDGYLGNVLENHDQPRVLSKLISNAAYRTETAAKTLATMYYFLPGVPVIYQGQELGMKNFNRESIDDFNDVSSINNYEMALQGGLTEAEALDVINKKSRDNGRVPMQWTPDEFGGFSDQVPWLAMGDDRDGVDVQTELANSDSVLHYYQALGQLRQNPLWRDLIVSGEFYPLSGMPADVITYQRRLGGRLLTVVINLSEKPNRVSLTQPGEVLCKAGKVTQHGHRFQLPPYTAIVLGVK